MIVKLIVTCLYYLLKDKQYEVEKITIVVKIKRDRQHLLTR